LEDEKAAEKDVCDRATASSLALRKSEEEQPDSDKALREGVSSSAEIGMLVLQKVGRMESDIRELKRRLTRQEDTEKSATDLLVEERRSQLGLQEEITRTDIHIRKIGVERRWKLITKVVAALLAPPGLWAIWKWIESFSG